ncbi:MAG: PolC-type DNA polymerase III [Eubacteriales bacterium]|nr:PolC-type DNA polymerase III [Eubacteriales bacterium]
MSKAFFDVFPKLKVRKELHNYFEDTQVERLAANRERTRLKVCLHSEHLIHKDQVFRMQKEMQQQLFEGRRVEVYVEEHYSLSGFYTPQRLMEEYSDSIRSEIASFSPVMGIIFRDARITYEDGDRINVCMRDTCISRRLQDRLEESLNRIFRDRCGVQATLTVTLDPGMEGSEPVSTATDAYTSFPGPGYGVSSAHDGPGGLPENAGPAHDVRIQLTQAAGAGSGPRDKVSGAGSSSGGSGTGGSSGNAGSAGSRSSSAGAGSRRQAAKDSFRRGANSRTKKGNREYSLKRSSHPDVIFGREVTAEAIRIADIVGEIGEVVIRGRILANDRRDIRNDKTIVKFSLTDYTDSIYCKLFVPTSQADALLKDVGKGAFVKVRGAAVMDTFDREVIVSSIQGIMKIPSFVQTRTDDAPVKRVELHLHTKMSDMDGVSECKDLVKRAYSWGMPAIAVTDHGNIQAFPDAGHVREDLLKAENKRRKEAGEPPVDDQDFFKVLYGVECYLVDDLARSVVPIPDEDMESPVTGRPVVVFDLETTGFSPEKNRIIEFGAVKIRDGKITDRFSQFVNPEVPIPFRIQKLTGISDSMVIGAKTIDLVLPFFLRFCEGCILVGHNVAFDIGFVKANADRLGLPCSFTTLDTLGLSRALLPGHAKYTLDAVAKLLNVSLENHHRAVDDAACTADIYLKMLPMLQQQGALSLRQIDAFCAPTPETVKRLRTHHCILLAKNTTGRTNLYTMVTESHLTYFFKKPRIPKSLLMKYREGILVGSACVMGELMEAVLEERSDEVLAGIVDFYDYLEIQPRDNNRFLLESPKMQDKYPQIRTEEDLLNLNRTIVRLGEQAGKPVVATGDVHFMDPEDEIYRTIIQEGMGMADEDPAPLYLRTTNEMLDEFAYLGAKKAREVVIDNPRRIADMVDAISPVRPDKCPPVIPHSDEMLRRICYDKAHSMYGDPLPEIVEERLERELRSIISNGYSVMYIIAQKLVWKSVEDGYLVGSRGSVGSSFAATMSGITEVNPLPPHYYCPNCHYSDFDSDLVRQYQGKSGIDLPRMKCPHCGQELKKDGFDIPFETFLGFKGDKEPDIDLNFSGEYQSKAHAYTKVIFGHEQTFKAGTIATVADKTAYGYVKHYFENKGIAKRNCEIERLLAGCTGIRRSTGQHPGGIVVLPMGENINTFTPVQHPANDMTTDIVTTHFDYHSIDHNLLKLDILGHDDPTMIRMLQDLTGLDPVEIPLDDPETMKLFSSTESLGITTEQNGGIDVGSLGIPEFGTKFVIGMLDDTRPTTMSELVRISGLSHGTDVWLGNAQTLIQEGKAVLSTAICTRDDIMSYLIAQGMDKSLSFKTMESVRKGKGLTPEMMEAMRAAGVPEWYIDSCLKIKYMFPRAHAAAYVMMALRIAYCKVHYPLAYYAAYFSIRASAFSYEIMCQGQEHLLEVMADYQRRKDELTPKEQTTLDDCLVVREMYARGFDFLPIDIYTARSRLCSVVDGKIMPSLKSIDGMGEKAADAVVEARKDGPFISRDDFWNRTKVPKTVIEKMHDLGLLGDLPETNQISLFDMFE